MRKIKNRVSIKSVLESFNFFPVKENSKTAFYFALDREEKVPSLSVDFAKNKAFDFGTGKIYDVISIVQQVKKCAVPEALQYLKTLDFSECILKLKPEKTSLAISYEITKISDIEHPALVEYLHDRKVTGQNHLVKEVHYRLKRKTFFGIGFKNDSGGFEVRNKYSKICLGRKDITLIKNKNNRNNEVSIFEGFFDYLTFRKLQKEDSNSDCLILNSTSMLFKAKGRLKEYDKISLFLDNDSNGKNTKEIIKKEYENIEDCSLLYENFKDLNEWFCSS
ncbi:DNA primase [Chryseobacterium carnipullorum]|uniref:toprim domain-containing protein n=1 Tax=Chryseobacterium carnipullorum TaxID=1124835 RepID=UPI000F4E54B6|nr:toprim domain-containing protein [Chryseobacterium carnipullorum]AZA66453.1 DNA primase [Chryseobacterium carnipullorum]